MICERKRGWRDVLVTEQRTEIEFAHSMRHIVNTFPDAKFIRVVFNNLNTHRAAFLCEAFPPEEAGAIARKVECRCTPKHGSGLNIAEVELAVLSNTCLSQRIPDEQTFRSQVEANVHERNDKAVPDKWKFSTREARRELSRLYPSVSM